MLNRVVSEMNCVNDGDNDDNSVASMFRKALHLLKDFMFPHFTVYSPYLCRHCKEKKSWLKLQCHRLEFPSRELSFCVVQRNREMWGRQRGKGVGRLVGWLMLW